MKELPVGQRVVQLAVGSQGNFVYFVVDWAARRAVLVDATPGVPGGLAAGQGLVLEAVLLTHTHADHAGGLPALLDRDPATVVHAHPRDWHRLDPRWERAGRLRALADGQRLAVGGLTVEVLHTPGHSAGACCFLVHGTPPVLLSGDTLFVRDCGRTDLDTGDNGEMFLSLQRLKRLPPETVVMPGHHYGPEPTSTMARELAESPPLRARDVEELASLP